MIHYIRQFSTLTRLTVLEAARQPLTFLLFVSALILVALLPLVLSHTLGESAKFVRDGALAIMMLSGLLLGAHLACASLTAEVRRGTVAAILSKPVQRIVYFLSKYIGISLIMTVFSIGLLMATFLSVRVAYDPFVTDWHAAGPLWISIFGSLIFGGLANFVFRRPFVSNAFIALICLLTIAFLYGGFAHSAEHSGNFGHFYDFRILRAGVLILFAVLVLSGISVSLATRFTTVPTLSICVGIFLLGLLSDYYFGRLAESHIWAGALYSLLPNWQHFWVVDALSGQGTIPFSYIIMCGSYAFLYLFGVLLLGLAIFESMELEG